MAVLLFAVSVLAGAGIAFILYFREKNSFLEVKQKLILAILRGLTVAVICLLLFSMLISRKERIIEKPVIAFIVDNSKSMIYSKDSTYLKTQFLSDKNSIIASLNEKADVITYSFSSELSDGFDGIFSGDQTDIFNALDELLLRYEGRNIGAIILVSDGISNTGYNPASIADRIWFPVYSVACGDTIQHADIAVRSVRYNKTVSYGNRFPIELVISATNCRSKSSYIIVSQDKKEIYKRPFQCASNDYSETMTFMFDADKKGLIKLEIQVIPIENEKNPANNYASAVIQVIDKKNKVAILYFAAHPDISAIKTSLEDAGNYEVTEIQVQSLKKGEISNYDAVIMYQLPDRRVKNDFFTEIQSFKIPWLMVIGMNSDLRQLDAMNTGLKIQQSSVLSQEAMTNVNSSFSLFQLSSEALAAISVFPPLIAPFGSFSVADNYRTLLHQKIGNIQTQNPMLTFGVSQTGIHAILVGEGIFKWKLYNYLKFQNHLAFQEIIQKTINLLVQQADKRRLRVFHKDIFFSTETAEMTAELYNMSMEMITGPVIEIILRHENGKERTLNFSPQVSDYRLTLGQLQPGQYSWNAFTTLEGEKLSSSGIFFVQEQNIEAMNTTADFDFMKYIAQKTGGSFHTLHTINNIPDEINQRNDIASVEYYNVRFDYLISLKWLLVALILFMTSEWSLRKFWGTY